MLLNSKGQVYNPEHLPKGRKQREAVLATLTEVHILPAKGGKTHTLEARAKVVS